MPMTELVNRIVVIFAIKTTLNPLIFLVVVPRIIKIGLSRRLIIVAVVTINVFIIGISDSEIICDIVLTIVSRLKSGTTRFFNDGRSGLIRGEVGIRADRDLPQINLFYLACVTASVNIAM